MKVNIIKKDNCNIFLNTLGIQLFGEKSAIGVEIDTEAQKREIQELKSAGLIEVIEAVEKEEKTVTRKPGRPKGSKNKEPKKPGRPKGSKNKKKDPVVAETAETKNPSPETPDTKDAVVSVGKSVKRVSSIKPEDTSNEDGLNVEASLKAAEEMDKEETVDFIEDDLPIQDQMGNEAVVATGVGELKTIAASKHDVNSAFIDDVDPDDDTLGDQFIEM